MAMGGRTGTGGTKLGYRLQLAEIEIRSSFGSYTFLVRHVALQLFYCQDRCAACVDSGQAVEALLRRSLADRLQRPLQAVWVEDRRTRLRGGHRSHRRDQPGALQVEACTLRSASSRAFDTTTASMRAACQSCGGSASAAGPCFAPCGVRSHESVNVFHHFLSAVLLGTMVPLRIRDSSGIATEFQSPSSISLAHGRGHVHACHE
eukprot:tig00021692_g23133.t1